jgi:hypothetical protein
MNSFVFRWSSTFVIVCFLCAGCIEAEIKPEEKSHLVDATDLEPYYGFILADSGKYNKTRFFDGSVELEYELEYEDENNYIYLLNTVSLEKSHSDAVTTYGFENLGTKMFDDGIIMRSMDSLFTYGTRSSLDLLLNEEDQVPIGNLFHCQVGKKVSYLLIAGIYFDNGEDWEEFISPHLLELSK